MKEENNAKKMPSFMLKTSRGEIFFAAVVVLIAVAVALVFLGKDFSLKAREVSLDEARAELWISAEIEPLSGMAIMRSGNIVVFNNGNKKISGYVSVLIRDSGIQGEQARKFNISLEPGETFKEPWIFYSESVTVEIAGIEGLYYE